MKDLTMQMEELLEDLEGNEELANPEAPLAQEDADGNAIPLPEEVDGDSLEDQAHAAMTRADELILVREMLTETGGVSREMVGGFKDVLPEGFALESFTRQVTSTNHRMCLEFVGTAIKLVMLTGVIAVLGTIGYALYRISKTKKRMPSNKLDKAVSAIFGTVEEKLKILVEGFKHTHPELEHPEVKYDRAEALSQAAIAAGVQELDLLMMSGKYKPLVQAAAPDVMAQAQEINKFFQSSVFPELEKLVRGGTGKDIDDISKKVMEFQFADRVTGHLTAFGKEMHLNFSKPDEVCDKFRTKYTMGVKAGELDSRLRSVSVAAASLPEDAMSTMYKAQDMMTSLTSKVAAYEKKMDKSKELPGDYVTQVKELLQKCKEPIRSLADVFTILEVELASQKRCCKIKALAVSSGYKAVAEFYQVKAASSGEQRAGYRDCLRLIQSEFDGVKAALKL